MPIIRDAGGVRGLHILLDAFTEEVEKRIFQTGAPLNQPEQANHEYGKRLGCHLGPSGTPNADPPPLRPGALTFDVPYCAISIVEETHQWSHAAHGLNFTLLPGGIGGMAVPRTLDGICVWKSIRGGPCE